MKDVLLLTACISPKGMISTALQDPVIRKAQYVEALKWYLNNTHFNIVFCENTNTNIRDEVCDLSGADRIEFLTFDGNDYDKSLGKGYGEAQIIKYANNHSHLIQQCDRVIKATGRVIIQNIDCLVKQAKDKNAVYADSLKVNGKMKCLSKFFIAPKSMIDVFLLYCSTINDSQYNYFEHVFYEAVIKWSSLEKKRKLRGFSSIIATVGFSGTSGKKLGSKKVDFTKFIHCFFHNRGIYRNHKGKD